MAEERDNGGQRADESMPAAAPQPGGAALMADELSEDPGLSGWLVMWGPLIIVGFLMLVFMGHEREPALPAAVVEESVSEPLDEASTTLVAAPIEPEPVSEEPSGDSAGELSAAFKAAGIPLPQVESSEPKPVPLPKDLQGSPWTPREDVAAAPPPPPGYGQAPYGYPPMPPPGYAPMPYGYPPAGYGQMPPGYGYMPPGYGYMPPGYGGAPGYGHGQMMQRGYGHMPPAYAPQMQGGQGEGIVPAPPAPPSAKEP